MENNRAKLVMWVMITAIVGSLFWYGMDLYFIQKHDNANWAWITCNDLMAHDRTKSELRWLNDDGTIVKINCLDYFQKPKPYDFR